MLHVIMKFSFWASLFGTSLNIAMLLELCLRPSKCFYMHVHDSGNLFLSVLSLGFKNNRVNLRRPGDLPDDLFTDSYNPHGPHDG